MHDKIQRWLVVLHTVAIALHIFSAYVGFSIDSTSFKHSLVYEQRQYRKIGNYSTNLTNACTLHSNTIVNTYTTICSDNVWDGVVWLSVMEIITAVFHLLYILECVCEMPLNYDFIELKAHPLRWIEYSCTATIITLATLSGIGERSLITFIIVGMLSPITHACGALAEIVFANRYSTNRGIIKWLFILGCIPQIIIFVIIAANIITTTSGVVMENKTTSTFNKWQIQSIVYSIHYLVFPVIFIIYIVGKMTFEMSEICYVSASIGSKMALFWLVISTLNIYAEKYNIMETSNISWDAVWWVSLFVPPIITVIVPVIFKRVTRF